MDGDCLLLNIWSLKSPLVDGSDLVGKTSKKDAPKPVLVFIPSSGFTSGGISLKLFDGTTLAAHGSIIVVTIQYRIGPLGFLYTRNDDIDHDCEKDVYTVPGNMRLWNILFVAKFVHENIAPFCRC